MLLILLNFVATKLVKEVEKVAKGSGHFADTKELINKSGLLLGT